MNFKRFEVRAVLFDWDGTLLDSYAADTRAFLAMFHTLGIKWGVRDLQRHYSPDWYRVYRAAKIPRARWPEADRLWSLAYEKEAPKLLQGARNVVQTLSRNFILAIVSSGNRRRVRRQLRAFGLANYFSACVCSEDAPKRKPHPAPLELALKRLRIEPLDCVYVGDAAEDIQMARRVRVRPIAVLGPFPTANRVRAARPDAILRSIRSLPRYLQAVP
jgi:HAD superfamily hydrolase (TIGR01509 family)